MSWYVGGWGEIRTHGGREPTAVFKTAALNRSATHPFFQISDFLSLLKFDFKDKNVCRFERPEFKNP